MSEQLKYPKELIDKIAQEIDMGMICYFNPDTLEVESVLGSSYNAYGNNDFQDSYQEVYDKVDSWKKFIRIDPPEAWQSFQIMENFIECYTFDNDAIRKRLQDVISQRKPFQKFKFIIDNSQYRQHWFDFKQLQLEQLITEQLYSTL